MPPVVFPLPLFVILSVNIGFISPEHRQHLLGHPLNSLVRWPHMPGHRLNQPVAWRQSPETVIRQLSSLANSANFGYTLFALVSVLH